MPIEITSLDAVDFAKVAENEAFLVELTLEKNPELDVADSGSVLRQLVIFLGSEFYTMNQTNMDRMQASGSLLEILADPTLADDELVDRVLSNHLITRQAGQVATGQIVIALSALATTPIMGLQQFTSTNGKLYTVTQPFLGVTSAESILSTSDRLIVQQADGTYTFSVDVSAVEAGEASRVRKGALFTASPAITNMVSATAAADFVGGTDTQTNEQLVHMLDSGISAKSTADRTSIDAKIRNSYSNVIDISCIGLGDPEMARDRDNLFGISGGGKGDIYVRSASLPSRVKLTKTATLVSKASRTWQFNLTKIDAPGFYRIEQVVPTGSTSLGTFVVTEEIRSMDMTSDAGLFVPSIPSAVLGAYSAYQTATVRFVDDLTPVGALVEGASTALYDVYIKVMPNIGDIQGVLSTREAGDPCADYLVKAAIPCFVSVSMQGLYQQEYGVPDEGLIRTTVAEAVNAMKFTQPKLSAATIIDAAHELLGTGGYVDLPVDLRGVLRLPDGTQLNLLSSDELVIPNYYDQGVSRLTTAFYLEPEDVEITLIPTSRYAR